MEECSPQRHSITIGMLDRLRVPASIQLRILRDAELVVSAERGYYVHYKVTEETLEEWRC